MRNFAIFFVLLFSVLSLRAQKFSTEFEESYAKAEYETALNLLNTESKKSDFFVQIKKAEILLRLSKIEEAAQAISEVKNLPSEKEGIDFELVRAEILLNKAQYDSALHIVNALFRFLEEKFPEEQNRIADAANIAGLIYWSAGKQSLALDYLQKALDIRRKIFGENHVETASVLNNIGLVFSQSGEFDKAKQHYENALLIFTKVLRTNHPKIANAYNNLGVIALQQNDFPSAISFFEEAKKIYETNFGNGHVNIAFVLNYLAQTELETKKVNEAKNYAVKALEIYRQNYGEKHPEISKTYNLLAKIALAERKSKRKKVRNALAFCQKSLQANSRNFESKNANDNPKNEDIYDPNIAASTLLLKGQILERYYGEVTLRTKHLKSALSALEQADLLSDKIRQSLRSKSDQIALSSRTYEIHEDGLRIALMLRKITLRKNFYTEKAFFFAEKSKAATLLAAVTDTDAKTFAKIPQTLLTTEKNLKDSIAFYEQKIAQKPSEKEEQNFRNRLFNLNKAYLDFSENLEKNFPEYYNLKHNKNLVSLAELQKIIPHDARFQSYFIAEKTNRIIVFGIEKNKIVISDLPKPEDFEKFVVGLRNAVKFKNDKLYAECAFRLYKELFPQKISKKIKYLTVIPDGILTSIPFECLLSKKKADTENISYTELPYLIKDFAIGYAFSATLLTQNSKKETQAVDKQNVFVCAPVRFAEAKLSDLPQTEKEVELICKQFDGEALSLTFENAHEGKIKSGILKDFSLIHFATHGTADEKSPDRSKILLSKESSSQEDGCLYAGEIYNLEIKADLVTLSACETGLGKRAKGEGVIGLSRAFLYAGAKNIIVSLWAVADESTANLMIAFYEKIRREAPLNEFSKTLQQAKKQSIAEGKFAHPYYWAAFVLIGN
jgi:CHAT domain-containing protein